MFQEVARIGVEVDAASRAEPRLPVDLMKQSPVRILSTRKGNEVVSLFLNMSDVPQHIDELNSKLRPHSARVSKTANR